MIMDIQAVRLKQIQAQAAIQIMRAASVKTATTGRIRRDTVSISKDGIFRSVSITDKFATAYYGTAQISGSNPGAKTKGCKDTKFPPIDKEKLSTVCLPDSYESLKDSESYFYHGETISDYDLVRLAVAEGKMEVSEDKPPFTAVREAFHVMIEEEAAPKYGWSSTKYSEDGKYTFTKKEDGTYKWHLVEDEIMGASLDDIAGWIASGTPNRNIETRYLNYLRRMDPELYDAAQNIGKEVRSYDLLTECYKEGVIGSAQHDYDLDFLALLFGMVGSEEFYAQLCKAKATGDFTDLFAAYQPEAAQAMQEIRIEQLSKTGGLF